LERYGKKRPVDIPHIHQSFFDLNVVKYLLTERRNIMFIDPTEEEEKVEETTETPAEPTDAPAAAE